MFSTKSLSRTLAFVSDNVKDQEEFGSIFEEAQVHSDIFTSDMWERLVALHSNYEVILVDLSMGGGLMALEICKQLWIGGFDGRLILLASRPFAELQQRYALVKMKEKVKKNPYIVFEASEASHTDAIVDTVTMTAFFSKGVACGKIG
ncbi:hypothetical protein DRO66_01890 [Candidatus Bathyarchaeota archaeon]|nr:MAG: hypothetical protein DRO66_01890 [Candidatus Bathyarchaeota archaeon]